MYLDYVKLICTTVPASSTGARFAVKTDPAIRTISTNNTTAITPTSPNSDVATQSVCSINVQSSATASALSASSTSARLVADASMGGIPVVGDELVLVCGPVDPGAYPPQSDLISCRQYPRFRVYTFRLPRVYLHRRLGSTGERRAYPPKNPSKAITRDGTLDNLPPFRVVPEVCPMNTEKQIPYYAPDGTSLGFRSMDAAKRLIAGGYVKPSYGRKGHLKAIWLQRQDGSSPVETHAPAGTRYSFVENLEHGRCWKLRRLDRRDEDGAPFSTRGIFLRVVADCLVG